MFKVNKYLVIGMLVMMICCVTAVSATDVNGTDDTVITDELVVDEVSEVVEDVEIDDASDSVVEEQNLRQPETGTVNGVNYSNYFNTSSGYTTTTNDLTFSGNFNAKTFGNFKINESITIDATDATFHNVGFDLLASNITLIGGEFYADASVVPHTTINVTGDYASVTDTVIDVYAPENQDFIAIDVANSNRTLIENNVITYECAYPNLDNTNYVIRVKNSPNITISLNEITSVLPFKNVDYWGGVREGMDMDLVAAIGINGSDGFVLYYNFLYGYIENSCEGFPTLDMVIICDSDKGFIRSNYIEEYDFYATNPNEPSYLYAIDVYRCDNLTIDYNELNLYSEGGTYISGTNNGTGAAYGIQLTGGYNGVVIDHNTINTKNNGPNAGIYSQNFEGPTNLTITNNNIYVEGNASFHEWSLVTGMELQDDYAYIANNTITVNNKGGYVNGSNAYGISFSQYYLRVPTFEIFNNTIELINGDYAIYTQISNPGSYATFNNLTSTHYTGDNAAYHDGVIYINGNY